MSVARQSFFDILLEQLQDPEVRAAIRYDNGTRMFDALAEQFGERFNWMFVNLEIDFQTLVKILQNTKGVREDTNQGVCFRDTADVNIIRDWAKVILKHAIRELLDGSNDVHNKILRLLPKQVEPDLPRNLIYAFFATYSAHLLAQLAASLDQYKIRVETLTALTLLFKECSTWIEQIWPMNNLAVNQTKRWPSVPTSSSKKMRFFGTLDDDNDMLISNIINNNTNKLNHN